MAGAKVTEKEVSKEDLQKAVEALAGRVLDGLGARG